MDEPVTLPVDIPPPPHQRMDPLAIREMYLLPEYRCRLKWPSTVGFTAPDGTPLFYGARQLFTVHYQFAVFAAYTSDVPLLSIIWETPILTMHAAYAVYAGKQEDGECLGKMEFRSGFLKVDFRTFRSDFLLTGGLCPAPAFTQRGPRGR